MLDTLQEKLEILHKRIKEANNYSFSEQPNDYARSIASKVLDYLATINLLPRIEWEYSIEATPEGGIVLACFNDGNLFHIVVFNEQDEVGCLILVNKRLRASRKSTYVTYPSLESFLTNFKI